MDTATKLRGLGDRLVRLRAAVMDGVRRAPPLAWDASLAALFLASELYEVLRRYSTYEAQGDTASLPVVVVIVTLRAMLFVFRRRFPLSVSLLVIATLITIPTNGLSYIVRPLAPGGGWWPQAAGYTGLLEALICLYTVMARRGRRWAIIAEGWFLIVASVAQIRFVLFIGPAPAFFFLIGSGLALYLGDVRRRLDEARSAVTERTRRIELERERASREAGDRERERVAANLQGVVARGLSEMVALAKTARDSVEAGAGSSAARGSIAAIEETGRAALADARRALGLLREDDPRLSPARSAVVPAVASHAEIDDGTAPSRGADPRSDGGSPPFADVVVAVATLAFILSEVGLATLRPWPSGLSLAAHPADLLAIALLIVPLAAGRRFPLPAALTVSSGFTLLAVAGHFFGLSALLALLVSVYILWAERPSRQGIIGVLVAAAAVAMAGDDLFALFGFPTFTVYLPYLPGACFLGNQERRFRRTMRRLEEQEVELKRLRRSQVERARIEERLRIARDLHDLTAHTLSVMTVQAGAARTVVGTKPDAARRSLLAVEETGRRARAELSEVFGTRLEEAVGGEAPGLAALPELARRMRDAGLSVDIDVTPSATPLPPGLDMSLYRVVQEALTNAARHAGPTRVDVRVRSRDDIVRLEVVDDGPRRQPRTAPPMASTGDGGHGLIGMRERVEIFGGRLSAGPRPGGGFAVTLEVPLQGRQEPAVGDTSG